MKPLFIFGTSGHAHDVADIADALGWRPVFVARERAEIDAWSGSDEVVLEEDAVGRADGDFAFGIGDNAARARVAAQFRASLRFPSLLHPDASFGRGQRALVEAQPGNVVFAGVRFTNHVSVGAFCSFNLNATVSHDVEIAPPAGITFASGKQTEIKISGIDKQAVGEIASQIRRIRPPEPYKGKGVRYAGETVRRKEGKKK